MNEVLNNRYQLDRLLGRKSGRRTWLAIDRQTQQQVVIKLLLFSADFEWDALKLFERESKTLQDLDHSAIPKYLDWFETNLDGNAAFALVQTYIPAPSLESVVRSGRTFSSDDLRNIAEQVLQILDYLHSRNPYVIHRDLKPSNLLLGDRTGNSPGMVYLVDFGSVQNLAIVKGGTITIVGTYGYMPPEQFGDRAVPASDLYSLGATLIYLATGKDPADLLSDDFQIQCDSMNHLEPNFRNWIQGLVVTSLRDRPSSVQEAIDRFVHPQTETNFEGKITSEWTQRLPGSASKYEIIEHSDKLFILKIPADRISVEFLELKIGLVDKSFKFIAIVIASPFIIIIVTMLISLWTYFTSSFPLLVPIALFSCMCLMFFLTRQKYRLLVIDQKNIYLTGILQDGDVERIKKSGVSSDSNMVEVLHRSLAGKHPTVNPKEQVWESEFYLPGSDHTITTILLRVGLQFWTIADNYDELVWLCNELYYYLKIEPTKAIWSSPDSGSSGT